jgi:hypothetical protein
VIAAMTVRVLRRIPFECTLRVHLMIRFQIYTTGIDSSCDEIFSSVVPSGMHEQVQDPSVLPPACDAYNYVRDITASYECIDYHSQLPYVTHMEERLDHVMVLSYVTPSLTFKQTFSLHERSWRHSAHSSLYCSVFIFTILASYMDKSVKHRGTTVRSAIVR